MISSNFCHHILITKTPFIFPKWLAFCRYYILFAKAISFLNMSLVLQMQKFSDIRTIGWIWLHILRPHHPSFTAFVSLGIFLCFWVALLFNSMAISVLCVVVYLLVRRVLHVPLCMCRSLRTNSGNWSTPSMMWVPECKLREPGL